MKKYFIKDEDNATYEVTEVEEDNIQNEDKPEDSLHDDISELTPEELDALKRLIPHVDELLAMCGNSSTDEDEFEEEDVEEEFEDEEPQEEIIDTDKRTNDSKSIKDSVVSNKKNVSVTDSEDVNDAISNAWVERYAKYRNGGNY